MDGDAGSPRGRKGESSEQGNKQRTIYTGKSKQDGSEGETKKDNPFVPLQVNYMLFCAVV